MNTNKVVYIHIILSNYVFSCIGGGVGAEVGGLINKSGSILTQCLLNIICVPNPKKSLLPPARTLQWRHNEPGGVSNHQPHDCLLNYLFRRRAKKTSKFRVTGLWAGNSPVTGEFPAQRASNAENVSIWSLIILAKSSSRSLMTWCLFGTRTSVTTMLAQAGRYPWCVSQRNVMISTHSSLF